MREIKFRAWDNLLGFMGEVRNIDFVDETIQVLVEDNEGYYFKDWWLKEVKTMQFTGLQDKYGVDIYEGDIINSDYRAEGYRANLHGYIVFFRGGFCARTVKVKYFDDCPMSDLIIDSTEIIGNIYENPELLEVE